MSHTCQQYKLRFEPRNPIFHVFAGPYFLSLFSEHPVALRSQSKVETFLSVTIFLNLITISVADYFPIVFFPSHVHLIELS